MNDVANEAMPVASMEKMRPIVHQTLSARVYQDLRELIISGQLQPGERLTLAGMAAALVPSAMPVREAINKLAADDALEILPNKSVRVPVLTRSRFQELVVIRLIVEGLAVEKAAECITDEQLARLAGLEQAFRREITLSKPNVNQIIQINKQFHFNAYAAAQMPVLLSLIEGLWLRIGPVLNLDLRNTSSRRRSDFPSVKSHRALLDALRAGDGVAAKTALAMDINKRSRSHSFKQWTERVLTGAACMPLGKQVRHFSLRWTADSSFTHPAPPSPCARFSSTHRRRHSCG